MFNCVFIQLNAFRNVYSTRSSVVTNPVKLVNNYRPVQKLHNRIVYSSFDVTKYTGASIGLYKSWLLNLISATVMIINLKILL